MNASCTLSSLPNGVEAVIDSVEADDPALADQLSDNGFKQGESVTITGRGLVGGSPLAVRLGRSVLALRRAEADAIRVTPR